MKLTHGYNRRTPAGRLLVLEGVLLPTVIALMVSPPLVAIARVVRPQITSIPVLYPNGRVAYRATPRDARILIREGLAKGEGHRKQVFSCIRLYDGPVRPVAGTKYTTRAETPVNPAGVLALKKIPQSLQTAFQQVQQDVLTGA